MRQRLLRILRDPLFVFALLGAGCFLLFEVLGDEREEIVLTTELREGLHDDFTLLQGRPPLPEEESALLERYIDEEILFREALQRGLHFGDARLRLMLIEKMRFLLAELPADPSEADLVAYYADHLDDYTREPRYTLRHVFFRDAPEDPAALLDQLYNGGEIEGEDSFWLGSELTAYHASMLRTVLGPEALQQLQQMDIGDWAGPLRSPRGYHFIRLDAVMPRQLMRYAEVREQVREDWIAAQRDASIEARLEPLRADYVVRKR